jgi:hypothetical protein
MEISPCGKTKRKKQINRNRFRRNSDNLYEKLNLKYLFVFKKLSDKMKILV